MAIPWVFTAVGALLSAFAGYRMRGPKGLGGFIICGVLACTLAVLLTLAIAWAHTACVEVVELCTNRGDENLSHWLHSLFAVPVFWILLLAFPAGQDRS